MVPVFFDIADGTPAMGEESLELTDQVQVWANVVLTWIGFGTLTGLFAKAIMPGRDPGGAIATLAMGIGGTVIGCGTLSFFYDGFQVSPLSPMGFCVATAGAFIILFFFRLLSGSVIDEAGSEPAHRLRLHSTRRRSSRRRRSSVADEY